MHWLEPYGKPIFQYQGTGLLSEIDGALQLEVRFTIVQMFDGRIFCELTTESEAVLLNPPRRDCTLQGHTEYGYTATVDHLVILSSHATYGPTVYYLRALVLGNVIVSGEQIDLQDQVFSTDFYITNFDYFSKMLLSEGFYWEIEEYTIRLQPLPDHKENTQIIQASESTGITSKIRIESLYRGNGASDAEKWATRLCWLLSLAQGCYISWICQEMMVDGRLLRRRHTSVPNMSSTGHRLIPNNREEFDYYIKQSLPVYVKKEQEWQLFRLVDMFVRAMMSQPFPEPRGLHLAILIDYMGGLYLQAKGKERLIDEETFSNAKTQLKRSIKKVLEEVFPDTNSRVRGKMLRHIGMFQFRPFPDAIRGMAKELGLKIDDNVVDSFVKERNSLAHRYAFSPDVDPLKAVDEMISFVSKFILALLEYEGFFYDWALPPGPRWENRKVRLELEHKGLAITDKGQQEG